MNSAEYLSLSPASQHVPRRAEHELVDMGKVAAEIALLNRTGGSRGPPKKAQRVAAQKGLCGYSECSIDKPKRPQFRCFACREGVGSYYHLQCLFSCHRSSVIGALSALSSSCS